MTVYTVSLFGHRSIDNIRDIELRLQPIIKELIQTKPYVAFLIGRNGDFDEVAASVIKRTQNEEQRENSDITLVLPYPVSKAEYYERYYDNVIIPESLHKAHPKAAITLRNKWIIDNSELVLVYTERKEGGAYRAMKYAESLNKTVVNLKSLNLREK